MGCVTATAKRRRRQAKQNYNHLAKPQRPKYRKRSIETLNAREQRAKARRQELQARGVL